MKNRHELMPVEPLSPKMAMEFGILIRADSKGVMETMASGVCGSGKGLVAL